MQCYHALEWQQSVTSKRADPCGSLVIAVCMQIVLEDGLGVNVKCAVRTLSISQCGEHSILMPLCMLLT